jgi:hypothetical protein
MEIPAYFRRSYESQTGQFPSHLSQRGPMEVGKPVVRFSYPDL